MLISTNANTSKYNWFSPSTAYESNSKFISTEYANFKDCKNSFSLLEYEIYEVT